MFVFSTNLPNKMYHIVLIFLSIQHRTTLGIFVVLYDFISFSILFTSLLWTSAYLIVYLTTYYVNRIIFRLSNTKDQSSVYLYVIVKVSTFTSCKNLCNNVRKWRQMVSWYMQKFVHIFLSKKFDPKMLLIFTFLL